MGSLCSRSCCSCPPISHRVPGLPLTNTVPLTSGGALSLHDMRHPKHVPPPPPTTPYRGAVGPSGTITAKASGSQEPYAVDPVELVPILFGTGAVPGAGSGALLFRVDAPSPYPGMQCCYSKSDDDRYEDDL